MGTQFSLDMYKAISKALDNTNGRVSRIIYNGTFVQLLVSGESLKISDDKTKKRKAVFVERKQRGDNQNLVGYSVLMKRSKAVMASLVKIQNPFAMSTGSLQCLVGASDIHPQLEGISEILNGIAAVQYDTTAVYDSNLNVIYVESPVYRMLKYWTEMRGFGLLKNDIRYCEEEKANRVIECYPLVASLFLVSAAQNLSTFYQEFLKPKLSLMREFTPLFAKMALSEVGKLIFLGMDSNNAMYNPLLSFGASYECSAADSISKALISTPLEFDNMSSNVISVPLKNSKMYWCTSTGLCKSFGMKIKMQWSQAYALLFLYGKLSDRSRVHMYDDPSIENIATLISQKYYQDSVWDSVANKSLITDDEVYNYLSDAELQYM